MTNYLITISIAARTVVYITSEHSPSGYDARITSLFIQSFLTTFLLKQQKP